MPHGPTNATAVIRSLPVGLDYIRDEILQGGPLLVVNGVL